MNCRGSRSRGRGDRRPKRNDGWEEAGGYMNAKRQKLKDQFDQDITRQLQKEDSGGSKIFAGVAIYVNGYTKPSSDELKRLMMLHGGTYETYLYRTRVTHVIATNLPDSKVKEIRGLKVVTPEWITDSIAAGKLLSYTKYQLYTAQSGLQKGLQSFSVQIDAEKSIQSTPNQSSAFLGESLTRPLANQSKGSVPRDQSTGSGPLLMADTDDTSTSLPCRDDSETQYFETGLSPKEEFSENVKESSGMETSLPHNGPAANFHAKAQSRSPAKAGDLKFLSEFYGNSRLHFLSTWKAEFKEYINAIQKKGDNFPGREKLRHVVQSREANTSQSEHSHFTYVKKSHERCIMHIDMDCFFVSVGLLKRPDLIGKPVAVTHSLGKGATVDPRSDLGFERREWTKYASNQKRVKSGLNAKMDSLNEENMSFPDQSESDTDDDVTDDVTDVSNFSRTSESFHSMAELASCSYEARKAGVKNGMFMGRARQLCPDLVTIPYDFEGYNTVSRVLYDTVASFTHDIEAVSCDEMLVDCTDVLADTGATPLEFAAMAREEIYKKTGCCASAGLGSSILLARLATRKAKPNGQFHLTPALVGEYIKDQSVRDIPGVGWSLARRFETMKVTSCGDLQRFSLDALQKEFGPKTGQSLFKYCRGQDDRPIKIEQQRKSVSAEVNYGIRFTMSAEAEKFMQDLSEEVTSRLRNIRMKGKTITLKLMVRRPDAPKETSKFMGHGICNNISKSVTLPLATDDAKIVTKETLGLLKQQKVAPEDLRGIGIQINKLEPVSMDMSGKSTSTTSILNFTVNKALASDTALAAFNTSRVQGDMKSPGKAASIKWKENVAHSSHIGGVSYCVDIQQNYEGVKSNSVKIMTSPEEDFGKQRSTIGHVLAGNNAKTEDFDFNHFNNILNKSADVINTFANDQKDGEKSIKEALNKDDAWYANSEDEDLFNSPEPHSEHRLRLQHSPQAYSVPESSVLTELGRRQTDQDMLPPLPCLPEMNTPESGKKSSMTVTRQSRSSPVVDFFPSPSQVDQDVLNELPVEIRQQIEKEIASRKKTSSKCTLRRSQEQGSSRLQQDQNQRRALFPHFESDNGLDAEDLIAYQHSKGGNSEPPKGGYLSPAKGSNSTRNRSNSGDPIVALPSPSQLDPSCLDALPESLQAELREAYARQNAHGNLTNRGGNQHQSPTKGVNFLSLKQASPTTSPNKRSPNKRSPQFKIPRGRPAGRGKKRGTSSKKTLFRDRKKGQSNKREESSARSDATTVEVLETDVIQIDDFKDEMTVITGTDIGDAEATRASTSSTSGPMDSVETITDVSRDSASVGVNLCGAVSIHNVRILLREWISSTPAPQAEDEEVLINYLQDLVMDKNLEQVDLVLKFMARNLKQQENDNWLTSLHRIFTQTQALVFHLYGSRLASISV